MKKIGILLALLMFGVVVAGCIGQTANTTTETTEKKVTPTTTTANTVSETQTPAPKYPLAIVDFAGRKVTIEKEPQRIVSLAPSITETLYFIGALDKVVGVTKFDNYPENVQEGRTVVGGFSDPSIEVIASLNPDLIVGTSMHLKYLEQLEKIAPVIIIDPKSIEEIYKAVELLGKVTNKEEKANEVVNNMQSKIEEIRSKVKDAPRVKVFYIVWSDPLMTAGNATFINDLIILAGGENIFGDTQGWPQVSVEEVLARNPEVIILPPHAGMSAEDLCNTQLINTDAVKNGRVYTLSSDDIVSRPSPRIVEGLEEIAKFLHQDVFNFTYQPLVCEATAG
ncbi:Vitamin B12 ABC transporter, B12-binding component BtuF [Thermococcus sp. 2319x1]|uniref:ABC transporter substrate-binding protein n=1 Tax=Thermococcus sp. 2319x1 TaxID=1674923 RepID=UPI00073A5DF1|nr:ABC transporter substrate-binding protein [Thermococcus sp. 2319x1]ALV63282.1 Vitamin B12 ABC transporter, B12-binding component BtuF [Thermococcus sp. 2319x1]